MSVQTARELRNRIAAKFGKTTNMVLHPEHLVLFEVPFMGRTVEDLYGAPRVSRQRIDVVALGIWAKTNYLLHGFEIKVTRADLLHELRDLSKSEHAVRSCDRWWLVLGDKALMREGDPIPESWGIIIAVGRGLRVLRNASPQPGERDPSLIAGIGIRALLSPRWLGAIKYRDGWIAGDRAHGGTIDSARRQGYDQALRDHGLPRSQS